MSVTSGPVALAAGAASGLTIKTQPGTNAQSAVALAPQPAVQLTDAAGNSAPQAGVQG